MSFGEFVSMTKNTPLFSNFARFCTPKRCTRVHCLVLKKNPNYVNFWTPDTPLTFERTPPAIRLALYSLENGHYSYRSYNLLHSIICFIEVYFFLLPKQNGMPNSAPFFSCYVFILQILISTEPGGKEMVPELEMTPPEERRGTRPRLSQITLLDLPRRLSQDIRRGSIGSRSGEYVSLLL